MAITFSLDNSKSELSITYQSARVLIGFYLIWDEADRHTQRMENAEAEAF